jgi:hypothetical protein
MVSNRRKEVLAIYALALLVPYAMEFVVQRTNPKPYRPSDPLYVAVWKPEFWYTIATTAGPRKPRARNVSLIKIARGIEPVHALGESPCSHREFMATLLQTVSRARPRAIVMDYWYSAPCKHEYKGTSLLLDAIREASATAPVILIRDSANSHEIEAYCPTHRIQLQSDEEVLGPTIPIVGATPDSVQYGLARLNADTRKIPLTWYSYPNCDAAAARAGRQITATLAVATVQSIFRDALRPFEELQRNVVHPFTSFITEDKFPIYSALNVICSDPDHSREKLPYCNAPPGDRKLAANLSHRIVLIGEQHANDYYDTVIGRVPGMVLHANYIESLMDERSLKPVVDWLQIPIGLLWFLVIELIFRRWDTKPAHALLFAVGVTTVLGIVFYYVVILHWGFYFVLLPPTITAIILRFISSKRDQYVKGLLDRHSPQPA